MKFVPSLTVGGLLVALSAAVLAAPEYCSSAPPASSNADGLTTSDMTYNGADATDCYGVVGGNDDATAINGLPSAVWGTGWALAARDNIGGSDTSNTVAGIQWTLSSSVGTTGTWTLTGVDTNGGAPANIGDTFDFVGVLKGGPGWAAYFFDNVVFDGSDGGTWKIVFKNPGGNIPDLSHMSVYARFESSGGGGGGGGGGSTPTPATLALLGAGLLGMAAVRRRRQS